MVLWCKSALGHIGSVVHEVHRLYLIDGLWHHQRLGLLVHQPLAGLDPQIELQDLVVAVHALMVRRIQARSATLDYD